MYDEYNNYTTMYNDYNIRYNYDYIRTIKTTCIIILHLYQGISQL